MGIIADVGMPSLSHTHSVFFPLRLTPPALSLSQLHHHHFSHTFLTSPHLTTPANHIFLKRKWAVDGPRMTSLMQWLRDTQYPYQVLIFPEGTDLSKDNLTRSHAYSDKVKLPKYNYVLHPRTTGFISAVQSLEPDAIYDITLAYTGSMPQNETDVILGRLPSEVHLNVRRHESLQLRKDDEALGSWLKASFRQKESSLRSFYERLKKEEQQQKEEREKDFTSSPLYRFGDDVEEEERSVGFPDEVKEDDSSMFTHGLSTQARYEEASHFFVLIGGITFTVYVTSLIISSWIACIYFASLFAMAIVVPFLTDSIGIHTRAAYNTNQMNISPSSSRSKTD